MTIKVGAPLKITVVLEVETQAIERVQEVPIRLVEEIPAEVPEVSRANSPCKHNVQIVEAIVEEMVPNVRTAVKPIPKVLPELEMTELH
eukprot:6462400-Amphidinium_carterae.1